MTAAVPASPTGDRTRPSDVAGRHADAAWRAVVDAAAAPYRPAGRFAHQMARGKLAGDPVFRHLVEYGLVGAGARVLDLGCGRGLLAGLLQAATGVAERGAWPAGWSPAPHGARVVGIDLSPSDIAAARAAHTALGAAADWRCADLRDAAFPAADVVVLLDVLHYLDRASQDAVLARAGGALTAGGRLLLRVGDAGARRGFGVSQAVDRLVCRLQRRAAVPVAGRPLADWTAALVALGFDVEARPMSRGTPFANVLLVAGRPATP